MSIIIIFVITTIILSLPSLASLPQQVPSIHPSVPRIIIMTTEGDGILTFDICAFDIKRQFVSFDSDKKITTKYNGIVGDINDSKVAMMNYSNKNRMNGSLSTQRPTKANGRKGRGGTLATSSMTVRQPIISMVKRRRRRYGPSACNGSNGSSGGSGGSGSNQFQLKWTLMDAQSVRNIMQQKLEKELLSKGLPDGLAHQRSISISRAV
jgi:uncharacterized membrane protein YgcG